MDKDLSHTSMFTTNSDLIRCFRVVHLGLMYDLHNDLLSVWPLNAVFMADENKILVKYEKRDHLHLIPQSADTLITGMNG